MCDGLADNVLPLLKQIVEESRFLPRVVEPKIVIYDKGYGKAQQRQKWLQHAIRACKKVFDSDGLQVEDLDLDDPSAMDLLQHCNIFHMAGGNAWKIIQDWHHHHPHYLQVLKERVQRGEVLYIGSSGGAISAGLDMRHCEDDRACLGLGDMGDAACSQGLGIIELNVGVHHSDRHKFNHADEMAVFLGPTTGIFLNGLQCEPAMAATVKPCVKESLLASPYIAAKLLHRPLQPIPTSSPASSSCENPITETPMTLQMMLQQGGDFLWNGSSDQLFHIQTQNAVFSSRPPLVVIWLSGSGGHKELAADGLQPGATATAIHDSAILVSPYSRSKHKADVPDWIVKLTVALTQEVGGRLVLMGFSRGAKWCHEILRQLITMNVTTMPLRCLLVAPYCAARFTVHDQREHALSIKRGLTTVRSICSMQDQCCPWQKYGACIKEMSEVRDVSEVFPSHEDILYGLLSPDFSPVALEVMWLLGTSLVHHV